MSNIIAVFNTAKGIIKAELFDKKVPLTVANFVNLAQRGFYENKIFHRVIPGFMVQGGCPNGTGAGTCGYMFKDEFHQSLRHSRPGTLSMANTGKPHTNSSQFFFTYKAIPELDDKHSVFGIVIDDESMETVDNLMRGDVIIDITIEGKIKKVLKKAKSFIKKWNKCLDKEYPELIK